MTIEEAYKNDIENANEIIAELQVRIDKAIEHINHCLFDYEEDSIVGEDFNITKRILMGSDKE